MPRITNTVQAVIDLDEIWSFIAQDNIGAADELVDVIDRRCQLLATQPMMGRARPELARDLRSFAVARYVIFYAPLADGIEVVRVLHGARDIATIVEQGGFD